MREAELRLSALLQRGADLWDDVLNPENWKHDREQMRRLDELAGITGELKAIGQVYKAQTETRRFYHGA